jgi:DNA-binding GntR family transcriptional regulator
VVAEFSVSPLSGKTGAICDEIERRLARGAYRFGDELMVSDLAKEFGVSRAPVMAALNYLRAEGYLIITPQVGCHVISPTLSQIEDFFLLYGKMEGAMASLAAERHFAPELEKLRQIQLQTKRMSPRKGELIGEEFVGLVADFHRQLHLMAHSEFEAARAERYWRISEFFLFNGNHMYVQGGASLGVADAQRAEIVAAIAARDSEKASQLMEAHMRGKPQRAGARAANVNDRTPTIRSTRPRAKA